MTLFYPHESFLQQDTFQRIGPVVQVLHCWVSWNIFPSLYTKVAAADPQMMS